MYVKTAMKSHGLLRGATMWAFRGSGQSSALSGTAAAVAPPAVATASTPFVPPTQPASSSSSATTITISGTTAGAKSGRAIYADRIQHDPRRAALLLRQAPNGAGAFGRSSGRAIAPTAGGMGAGALGAILGGLAAGPPGSVAGGALWGYAGGQATGDVQDWVVRHLLSPQVDQIREQMAAQDAANHPVATFAGQLAPMALTGRPNLSNTGEAWASRGIGAGLGAAQEAVGEAASGQPTNPGRIFFSGLAGGLYSGDKTAAGDILTQPGEAIGNRIAAGRVGRALLPEPPGALKARSRADLTARYGAPPMSSDGASGITLLDGTVLPGPPRATRSSGTASKGGHGVESVAPADFPEGLITYVRIRNYDDLRSALKAAFNYDEPYANDVAAQYESIARAWAKRNNRSVEDWYTTHIAGISHGEASLARTYEGKGTEDAATVPVKWLLKNNEPGVQIRPNEARQIIAAFSNPDATAAGHELGHVVWRQLDASDIPIVERWLGTK
jgi:hypothetical protein